MTTISKGEAVIKAYMKANLKKGDLTDKKKMAEALGYTLLETENFSVKNKVRLLINGEEQVRMWEPIQTRYKKKSVKGKRN